MQRVLERLLNLLAFLLTVEHPVTADEVRHTVAGYDQETDEDLARGIAERFLDESLATELAGLGESDVLQRLMPSDANLRILNDVAFYGSFLFKHADREHQERLVRWLANGDEVLEEIKDIKAISES